MTKQQLYFLVVVLSIALAIVLFWPTEQVSVDESEIQLVPEASSSVPVDNGGSIASPEIATISDVGQAEVMFKGIFIGLIEAETEFDKRAYKYMLVDDGTEIVRIDLRPLIGFDVREVEEKLGVTRGDSVRVTGTLDAGEFTVVGIAAGSEEAS